MFVLSLILRKMLKNLVFRTLKRQTRVMSTHNIKPAFPTHSSLKHYNFSPIDQCCARNYIPIVFYYPNNYSMLSSKIQHEYGIAAMLKRSLSEILVQYYPFSGRLKSSTSIDCNDEGVEFEEVDIEYKMDEVVDQESVSLVFPDGGIWGNVHENSPLLTVRLAYYICGGVSIAVCLSHKLGDAKSFETFMRSWATKTRHLNSTRLNENVPAVVLLSPHIISRSASNDDVSALQLLKKDWATERFLFPSSKLAKLKEIVSHKSGIEKISSFEVLTALLSKCSLTANTATSGYFTPSTLVYPMNIRNRMLPPLPENSIGNYFWLINSTINSQNENNLITLVEKIKNGKIGIRGINTLDATLLLSTLKESHKENYDLYYCSSLCKMQFYRVDFGWGNPSRVSVPDGMFNNSFSLMDTPNGDGIEAVVALSEKSMAVFQEEKDIREFTSSQKYY